MRMLLVDYDDGHRMRLARQLRRRGLEVECCSHASHAVARLVREPWDAVVCSILVAGDGLSVLRAAQLLSPRPRCIGYTTFVSSTVLARTAACCDWVLVGRATATDLVSIVNRAPPGDDRSRS